MATKILFYSHHATIPSNSAGHSVSLQLSSVTLSTPLPREVTSTRVTDCSPIVQSSRDLTDFLFHLTSSAVFPLVNTPHPLYKLLPYLSFITSCFSSYSFGYFFFISFCPPVLAFPNLLSPPLCPPSDYSAC